MHKQIWKWSWKLNEKWCIIIRRNLAIRQNSKAALKFILPTSLDESDLQGLQDLSPQLLDIHQQVKIFHTEKNVVIIAAFWKKKGRNSPLHVERKILNKLQNIRRMQTLQVKDRVSIKKKYPWYSCYMPGHWNLLNWDVQVMKLS